MVYLGLDKLYFGYGGFVDGRQRACRSEKVPLLFQPIAVFSRLRIISYSSDKANG